MSKSIFKQQTNYKGEWRDWSVLTKPKPALVLPPPDYHIYSGLQGFLTYDNKDIWAVKKTQKLLGDLAKQNNHSHMRLKELLDNKYLTTSMLKDKNMRFLFLDFLTTHMLNTVTLFNYNCAKVLYENIIERTVTIGNSFNQLLSRVIRTEFNITDTTFITEYMAFNQFKLNSVETFDIDKFTFTVSDSFEQPTIKITKKTKLSNINYTFEPLDWLCGEYADDLIAFIEYKHISEQGEPIQSTCGHYSSYLESESFFISLTHLVDILVDFIYDSNLQITSDERDKYFDIIISLIYDSALIYTRLTLNLPSILAYDNR